MMKLRSWNTDSWLTSTSAQLSEGVSSSARHNGEVGRRRKAYRACLVILSSSAGGPAPALPPPNSGQPPSAAHGERANLGIWFRLLTQPQRELFCRLDKLGVAFLLISEQKGHVVCAGGK
jgi:hypothetical protein